MSVPMLGSIDEAIQNDDPIMVIELYRSDNALLHMFINQVFDPKEGTEVILVKINNDQPHVLSWLKDLVNVNKFPFRFTEGLEQTLKEYSDKSVDTFNYDVTRLVYFYVLADSMEGL